MAVETIIVGLRGASWGEFSRYFDGSDWKAALKSASADHLLKALSDLNLDEEQMCVAISSLGARFKKSLYYSQPDIFETNASMNEKEYDKALASVTNMLESMKNFNVRYLLYETLGNALAARHFSQVSERISNVLMQGLKDEPRTAVLSAEILANAEEYSRSDDKRRANVIAAMEECAERLKRIPDSAVNRGKVLDAVDRISFGIVRANTDYRAYLGDGELLRAPMFSSRPVPSDKHRDHPKNKEHA